MCTYAQRHRLDANWCAVALDVLVPRPGRAWRAVCCICVDALEVAGLLVGDHDAHRMNLETGHDMGACSFCESVGRDTLVASIADDVFEAPPSAFLEIRCGYRDRGGRLASLPRRYPTIT